MWNIRGIRKGEKCLTVKNLIPANKIDFLGLIILKQNTGTPYVVEQKECGVVMISPFVSLLRAKPVRVVLSLFGTPPNLWSQILILELGGFC